LRFLTFQKCGFGRVTPERICRWLEVRAIQLYDSVQSGNFIYIPCAVLFGIIEEIPPANRKWALTMFPRYVDQMDVLTNIINRRGILIKGEQRTQNLNLDDDG
jgi:hypothetical protein